MSKTIRIDNLPLDVQKKMLAMRDKARAVKYAPHGVTLHFVTQKQLERALNAIDSVSLGNREGWNQTNNAVALGRVMLRYFEENPAAKARFKDYTARLQSGGVRVMHRKDDPTLSKTA